MRYYGFGPAIGVGRILYLPLVLMFLVCFIWQFFIGHFSTAGAFLLCFAVFAPWRRVRSRHA